MPYQMSYRPGRTEDYSGEARRRRKVRAPAAASSAVHRWRQVFGRLSWRRSVGAPPSGLVPGPDAWQGIPGRQPPLGGSGIAGRRGTLGLEGRSVGDFKPRADLRQGLGQHGKAPSGCAGRACESVDGLATQRRNSPGLLPSSFGPYFPLKHGGYGKVAEGFGALSWRCEAAGKRLRRRVGRATQRGNL
jgi:hypothetical protein